jgi:cytochrome d ubiquinol oxidase subunit I
MALVTPKHPWSLIRKIRPILHIKGFSQEARRKLASKKSLNIKFCFGSYEVDMDSVLLSRIQFAFTSGFHYIYPPLSIGLGLMLVIIEGMYLKTKNPLYKQMAQFWTKIFALTFALGVATGLVQLFGFGTNWASYSRFTGDVFGGALAAEGIFAFFLESGFLGIMLFGWERVKPKIHYLSTVCVAVGAHFSAIWIVVANSWMQTPAGFKIVGEGADARAVVTDFWQVVFNPSSVDRLVHVVLGCWLAGIFLFLSVSAYYALKKKFMKFSERSLKLGLVLAAIVLLLQLISADSSAEVVAKNQPAKLAAMEGVFNTQEGTPMGLIGWADEESKTMNGIKMPGLLSFLVYRDFKTPVVGLDQIPRDEWPPVNVVFQTYHLMIYMWCLMAVATVAGLLFLRKKTLAKSKWTLRVLVLSVLFPQIANQVGWMTAEIGRQPWIVWGQLRTFQGVSKYVDAHQVLGSLIMFFVIYMLLFVLFLFLLDRKIKHGPEETKESEPEFRNVYELKSTP